jgi:hypothetical protein
LKADPVSLDQVEVKEVIGELKAFGAAGEAARLSSSTAIAEAIAPFRGGAVPLGTFAEHLRDMRGEAFMAPDVRTAIDEAAEVTGVPLGYLYRTAKKESRFDAGAKATTSSAQGLFQFTWKTWSDTLAKHSAKYGLSANTPRTDPRASALMAAELSKENEAALVRAGLPVSDGSLYLLHFAGAEGGIDLLEADPEASAASVLPAAAKSNRAIFYDRSGSPRTVAAVIGRLTGGFDGAASGETAGLPASGEMAREAQQLFVKQAKDFWPFLKSSLERGQSLDPEDFRAVQYAASLSGDANWLVEVNAAVTAAGIAPATAAAPAAQTKAELDRLYEQFAADGWAVDEIATFRAIEDQFNQQQKPLTEDPITFAVRHRGARSLEQLNFDAPQSLSDGLSKRVMLARAMGDSQGLPEVSIFSAGDKSAIASAIGASYNVKADLARGAAAAAGREAPRGPRADENAFAFLSAIPDEHLIPSLSQPEIKSADGTFDIARSADSKPLRYRWTQPSVKEDRRADFELQRRRIIQGADFGRGIVPAL